MSKNGVSQLQTYNDPMDRSTVPSDFRLFNRTTSGNQQNLDYGYDAVGNLISIDDNVANGTAWRG